MWNSLALLRYGCLKSGFFHGKIQDKNGNGNGLFDCIVVYAQPKNYLFLKCGYQMQI